MQRESDAVRKLQWSDETFTLVGLLGKRGEEIVGCVYVGSEQFYSCAREGSCISGSPGELVCDRLYYVWDRKGED